MRSLTLQRALKMPLNGKRVLDIGCAEGAAALSAARMGARVTGLEPKPGRFKKARKISKNLGVPLELHNMILDGYDEPGGSFDVVMALNVIHHVNDPFAFLDRAAHLTRSHLVLEYPGLGDRKFGATVPGKDVPGDELPLIAVSLPAEQDQTYVFTPASFERYLVDILGVFGKHEIIRVADLRPLDLGLLQEAQEERSGQRPGARVPAAPSARGPQGGGGAPPAPRRRARVQHVLEGHRAAAQGHRQVPLTGRPHRPGDGFRRFWTTHSQIRRERRMVLGGSGGCRA